MPDLSPDCYLSSTINHEAWYWDVLAEDSNHQASVMVHASSAGGGVEWEFPIEEVALDSTTTRAHVFADAYRAFIQVPELFTALADEQPRDIRSVVAILDRLGALDATRRVDPYAAGGPTS